MKIIFTLAILFFFIASVSAQELVSNRGEHILPEKGNWGIAFDAVPFLQYAGNLLNNSTSNATPQVKFPSGYQNTLVLKKYKSDSRAIRFKFTKGSVEKKDSLFVVDLGSSNPAPSVWDGKKITRNNFAIGIGFQKEKGKGRLRGYRGAEVLFGFPSTVINYTYGGGPLTQFNWLHTNSFAQGAGVTEIKDGRTFSINLHIVIGAEYFFAPKISLSAEFSWGMKYQAQQDGKKTKEASNFSTNKLKTTSVPVPGDSSFLVDNDNNAGSINLAIYF